MRQDAVTRDMLGLRVVDLTVRYGSAVALDNFSLDVADGQVVAVIGPSGSGKSTLLRAIAGLEPLAAGAIEAGGRPLAGVPTHERDLGLMFQDHALFPHLNVADNVAFGLRMKSWSAKKSRDRVGELLELVGLAGFGARPITELSGGEAQRVALVRALAPEPALLMLDEPFGSLDRVLRDQLTGEVRRLLNELEQTALHVTHDQAEAFTLADNVAILRDGRLEQLGAPSELWREPSSAFVAEFLGHPNIWPITVDAAGMIRLGSWSLGLAPHLPPSTNCGVVPVRALRRDPDGPIRAVVEQVRFSEGGYRVEAHTGDEPTTVSVTFEASERLQPGDEVSLAVSVEEIHPVAQHLD